MKLYTKILIGLFAGTLLGWILHAADLPHLTAYTDYLGDLFIRLIKMVVVPLILASLILGAANLGNIRKLGGIGGRAMLFFLFTTAVAVGIGISVTSLVKPGRYLDAKTRDGLVNQYREAADRKLASGEGRNELGRMLDILVTTAPTPEQREPLRELQTEMERNRARKKKLQEKSEFLKVLDILVQMAPVNPVGALARGDMLSIIFFSIFLGICITLVPRDKATPLLGALDGLNEAILVMVNLAMRTAPYGVFALMAGVVANMGISILKSLAMYGLVVMAGLFLHVVITHAGFIFLYLRENPLRFFNAIREALLLGFSTSSSSATLPVSMDVSRRRLGISNEVSSFVLPLGATINMDGTALYQGAAAIFIAQVYGIDLTITQQLTMILTATLASIGAAGVPGAGMITLAVVLGTAKIPAEGIALIFGLDRLLDMMRTSVNIAGDLTCSAVMAKSQGERLKIGEQSPED